MNGILKPNRENPFAAGRPWIRCLILLGAATLIASIEWAVLAGIKDTNTGASRALERIEASNSDNEGRLNAAINKSKLLLEGADLVLNELLNPEQDPDLGQLEAIGVQDYEVIREASVVRVRVSKQKIDYHAFVSALNQQEITTPLMRITWLSLRTAGKPFNKSNTPLQIDLEMAFPRITAAPPSTSVKTHARKTF